MKIELTDEQLDDLIYALTRYDDAEGVLTCPPDVAGLKRTLSSEKGF